MKMTKRTARAIIRGIDLWFAALSAGIVWCCMPAQINGEFAKDAYLAGLSVLSIIFSVFFASSAAIMTSTKNDFVLWMDKNDSYSELINRMHYTLIILFLSLILSVLAFSVSSYFLQRDCATQSKYGFVIFLFLFLYSLFSAMSLARASIIFTKYRARFIEATAGSENKKTKGTEDSARA